MVYRNAQGRWSARNRYRESVGTFDTRERGVLAAKLYELWDSRYMADIPRAPTTKDAI